MKPAALILVILGVALALACGSPPATPTIEVSPTPTSVLHAPLTPTPIIIRIPQNTLPPNATLLPSGTRNDPDYRGSGYTTPTPTVIRGTPTNPPTTPTAIPPTPIPIPLSPELTQGVQALVHCVGHTAEYWLEYGPPEMTDELVQCINNFLEAN